MEFLPGSAGQSSRQLRENEVKTITNTPEEMPDNVTDRPLVTFALFAYNQEESIREAVEGALEQTYEPLEIILSDDCSTDNTFEIMQEMAASYQGSHKVVVRQSPTNRRLMGHINDVVALSRASIIVVAAGDDISLPERTAQHVAIYTKWPDTFAVCSEFFTMSDTAVSFSEQRETGVREFTLLRHISNVGGWGRGATYSYRRSCFHWPMPIPEEIEIEDRVLPTRAAILGKVAYHKGKLVRYRTPWEAGKGEIKLRWQREESLSPIVKHLNAIFRAATQEGKLSQFSKALLQGILYISYTRVVTDNTKHLSPISRVQGMFSKIASWPLLLILKLQRLIDFYSPVFPFKRRTDH